MTFTKKFTRLILVVDDEPLIRKLHTEVLIGLGFEVHSAEDGSAALEMLQRKQYDLLITDNIMPKLSGIGLLKKIHAANMALPVIFATGLMPTREFATQPWLQPAVLLLKPYGLSELVTAVDRILTARHVARREEIADQREPSFSWQIASPAPAFRTESLCFLPYNEDL